MQAHLSAFSRIIEKGLLENALRWACTSSAYDSIFKVHITTMLYIKSCLAKSCLAIQKKLKKTQKIIKIIRKKVEKTI